jgi:hypothetical protein
MVTQIGRKPQNTYIGKEVSGITQTPYIPPSLSYKITPLSPINYKEVQKKAFKSRELVGQPKRENIFDAVNNMPSNLAYGNNTIIVRGKARKKETLKENIERNNNRFTNKAIDKYGNQIINQAGNPVEYIDPTFEGNIGEEVIYPKANITTAERLKQQQILKSAKNKLSRFTERERQKRYVEQYNKDHPDNQLTFIKGKIGMTLDLDQGPPRSTHVGEMKDQGPPRHTHISDMREDVPHREGLKTTGLTSQEIADLELSEEEMAAVGGEDLPITEKEKGLLKTSGLAKKELQDEEIKKVTIANINKNFDRLVDEAKNLEYDEKLTKYNFIREKLIKKVNKIKEEHADSESVPTKVIDLYKETIGYIDKIDAYIKYTEKSPIKTIKTAKRSPSA